MLPMREPSRNPGRPGGAVSCVLDEPLPTALVPRRFASQLRPDRFCSPWRDLGRRSSAPQVSSCEGFRMPAGCDVAGSAEGRRPKASKEGTRGGRTLPSGVYGDLTGANGGRRRWGRLRWRRWIAWSADRSRERWRGVRSRAPRPVDVGAIGGPGRRIGWMRVRSACRWWRWPAAGLRCDEGFLGVMRPRS
jgi:hypothetical protein